MGERKVLNKYFPADFDPTKIPKRHFDRDAPQDIRMMLPFSLCCLSCGHYMYRGKKFNSKKETAKGMDYLGVKRLRFTIKCEACNAKISFLTDPKNQDYECESGASRNFEAWRETKTDPNKTLIEKQNDKTKDSMERLEERTLDSKREMDILEALSEIKSRSNARQKIDMDSVLDVAYRSEDAKQADRVKEDEEAMVARAFRSKREPELKLLEETEQENEPKVPEPSRVQQETGDASKEASKNDEEVEVVAASKKRKKKHKKKKVKKAKKSKALVTYSSSD